MADSKSKAIKRCPWCVGDPLYEAYHDKEWGVPCRDDRKLFEMIILEGFQAGLSWRTILHKRANFRKAFDRFNPSRMIKYTQRDVERLLKDAGIIRNRLKIESAIHNAHLYFELKKEFGTFADYLWQFAPKRSARRTTMKSIPVSTKESDALAKDLKARGFKFLGTTTCYAFMQAAGMVNDHLRICHRYSQ